MNTIDELIEYCIDIEPVGALLLTGEWGCGKTYLIEREFREKVKELLVVIRFSLFGVSSLDKIHLGIKSAWLNEFYKAKGANRIINIIKRGKKATKELDFMPKWLENLISIDITSFIKIKNEINGKRVVLVFDDLERCQLSSVDVLGIINEYCENQKFHTIIVANQEKIKTKNIPTTIQAHVQINSPNSHDDKATNREANVTFTKSPFDYEDFSYSEIKEKIIHKTVHYIPNYSEIVHSVIKRMKYKNDTYKTFVGNCEKDILNLFAPDRDDYNFKSSNCNTNNNSKSQTKTIIHNVRSLKCAIRDFYRIYDIFIEKDINDIKNWFYSFMIYTLAYRANVIKAGLLEYSLNDKKVGELYPAYQSKYMFDSEKQWILTGIWDEEAVYNDIENIIKRQNAQKPSAVIKYNRIVDIEEDVIEEGFKEFLDEAYNGLLSLDEYVLFIENVGWAVKLKYNFPIKIDWGKIEDGVNKQFESLKKMLPEGQLLFHIIGDDNEKYFSAAQWKLYKKICDFAENGLILFQNRKLYIEEMKSFTSLSFVAIQNKKYDAFDEEMAEITFNAFVNADNHSKRYFAESFKYMWKGQTLDANNGNNIKGFSVIMDKLIQQAKEYRSAKKTIAAVHTENFIEVAKSLVDKYNP